MNIYIQRDPKPRNPLFIRLRFDESDLEVLKIGHLDLVILDAHDLTQTPTIVSNIKKHPAT